MTRQTRPIIHLPSVPPAASSSSDHHEPPPVPPQDDPQLQPMSRNGHVLQLLPTGGAFCRKCGKQTKDYQTSSSQDSGQALQISILAASTVA